MPRHTTSPQDIVDQSQDRDLPLSVHALPPEIVGIIFTMLDETWLQPSNAGMPPVLAVSRTCRRWRHISLSLPSLWSSIAIHFEGLDLPDYHQTTLVTRLFMDRSQKHPLRLLIYFNNIVSLDGKEDTVIPILRTLVQHSERWHNVRFYSITRAVMSHQVCRPLSGPLPILENLVLDVDERLEDVDLGLSFDLFRDCPSLTRVSWAPDFSPLTNRYLLAWRQLRELELYFTDIRSALGIATSGTSIEELALCHCSLGSGDSSGHLPLPSVTHLWIDAAVADEAYCPFKCLTLQRLSFLDIFRRSRYRDFEGANPSWEDWDEKPIRGFFERSGCAVTSLSLRGVPISDEQLIQLLQLMPALSSLRLEEYLGDRTAITNRTVTQRFLQKLTIDNTSSPFLPKLTKISLGLHEDGLANTVLSNALISRWMPDGSQSEVACIKTVDIVFVNEPRGENLVRLLSKLRLLRDRGVWVAVAYMSKRVNERLL